MGDKRNGTEEAYAMRDTPQNRAAEAAFLTTHNIGVVLETAAKTLSDECGAMTDTVAQAVVWQLRAAAKELEACSESLQDVFWF
jgi:hypothetical protein